MKAPGIMDLIDKLPGEGKRAARFYYEMLCDFVHPSAGSHILLLTRADANADRTMSWTLSREAISDEALLVLLHVISIPVRDSIDRLIHDFEQMRQVHADFQERRRDCDAVGAGVS